MLTIENLRRGAEDVPSPARAGLGGLLVAGVTDLIAHLQVGEVAGHVHQHTSTELSAHLAGFVSMVIVLAGVVLDGVRQQRARRRSPERTRKGVA